jgi:hypothetical protein
LFSLDVELSHKTDTQTECPEARSRPRRSV